VIGSTLYYYKEDYPCNTSETSSIKEIALPLDKLNLIQINAEKMT